jgi:ubiquinone/menaquinone biosynthesis C-methylase UbiE
MSEVNLLDSLPQANRSSRGSVVTNADRAIAQQFGREYFDGPRTQGYGGYVYDGRWKPVARRLKEHFTLGDSTRILDVGCAKGFLMHDLKELMPGAQVEGIDVSEYARDHSISSVKPFIRIGNAKDLPYPEQSFDLVLAINSIHNLEYEDCERAIREIQRVGRGKSYIVVDAYRDEQELRRLKEWILTAKTYLHVDEWCAMFDRVGYTGDHWWTICA